MENIEEKQNYLRENVLEKGYDTNVFMEFLVLKKGEEAADLNAWTFDEIKSTVQEFTTNFQPSNPISAEVPVPEENTGEEQNSVPVDGQPQLENTQEGQEGEVPVDDNGNQLVRKPTEPYKQHLPCAKTEETEISKCDNLTITLSFPEKVEGGISYSVQFAFDNLDDLDNWDKNKGLKLNKDLVDKFQDKVAGFSTLLEEIEL